MYFVWYYQEIPVTRITRWSSYTRSPKLKLQKQSWESKQMQSEGTLREAYWMRGLLFLHPRWKARLVTWPAILMCRNPFKSAKGLLSSETYTAGLMIMNFFENFCNCFLCDGFRSDDGFVSDTNNLYFRTFTSVQKSIRTFYAPL